MKAICATLVVIGCILSTVATAAAFIKIDAAMRTTSQVTQDSAVIYGTRIGPNGQEMIITTR